MGNLTAEYRHVPVMLSQVLAELDPKVGEVVCDCTLGGAGHSVELARRIAPEGLLVGIDQDDMALEAATARLASEVPGAEVSGRNSRPVSPCRGMVFIPSSRYHW